MDTAFIFRDRAEAGRALAHQLAGYAGRPGVIVLGVGRGGLAVAHEVASALDAPLDLLLIGRIQSPGHQYVTIGAVTSDGAFVLDRQRIAAAQLASESVEAARTETQRALVARESRYRGGRPALDIGGREVILVDDGMATGSTMRLAVELVRTRRPRAVVVASPVASEAACAVLNALVDTCVHLASPVPVGNVAYWYHDFAAPDDATLRAMLQGVIPSASADARGAQPAAGRSRSAVAGNRSSAA